MINTTTVYTNWAFGYGLEGGQGVGEGTEDLRYEYSAPSQWTSLDENTVCVDHD